MNGQGNVGATLVGAFVLSALAVAVAAVLVFGGGALLEDRLPYVLYFEGSVTGLGVGAPVTFRGVEVGSVTRVAIAVRDDGEAIEIPVHVQLYPKSLAPGLGGRSGGGARRVVERLVEKGLRAQLELQSLVTGQLMVELDFHPEQAAQYRNPDGPVPELPTVPSSLEQLTRSLESIPLQDLMDRALRVFEGIDQLVRDPNVKESVQNLNRALEDLIGLVGKIDARLEPVARHIEESAGSLNRLLGRAESRLGPVAGSLEETLKEMRTLFAKLDKHIDGLAPSMKKAAEAASGALTQAEKTMAMQSGPAAELAAELKETVAVMRNTLTQLETTLRSVDAATGEGSALRYEATRALHELSNAARSLRSASDYLQRHPESLLHGKPNVEGR